MNKIHWQRDRFHCDNEKLEAAHELVLESKLNSSQICKQMRNMGFDVDKVVATFPSKVFPDNLVFYLENFSLSQEGKFFRKESF
jgi:hypothetical protein